MLGFLWWFLGLFVPGLDQIIHVVLAALVIASAVRFQYARFSGVAFHALAGAVLLIYPGLLHSPMVSGRFDVLHSFLQRFAAPFHIGMAFYNYRTLHDRLRTEPVIYFAKAFTALMLLFTQLFTAYHLYESKERGLQLSDRFTSSSILLEGIWFAVEAYRLWHSLFRRDPTGELNLLSKQTQRYLSNHDGAVKAEIGFLADAAVSFLYGLVCFAFPNQILRMVVKQEYPIDGLHKMFSREFGIFMMMSGIISLLASQFTVSRQLNYIYQRVLTQVLIFLLHMWGHWAIGLYSTLHITPFMISGFYITLLLNVYYKIKAQLPEGIEDEDDLVASATRTTIYKKTTKTT